MARKNQDINIELPEINYLITYEQMNTLITFQKLWSQLATWMRSLMVSTVGELENKTAIVNHLFTIPTDLYNVFRVFYGPVISQQFLSILTNFIANAWRLIDALKSGESETVDQSTVEMYQNADELAKFLSQINVYWDEKQWKNIFHQFVKLLIEEMVAILGGEHEREIQVYNKLEEVATVMGSYMARGIIARSIINQREAQGQHV